VAVGARTATFNFGLTRVCVLPQISASGARLVAISPQLPDNSLDTANKNALRFDVLSDVRNEVALSYGLVYSLPGEIRAALRSNNKALPSINGDERWELPRQRRMSSPATSTSRLRTSRLTIGNDLNLKRC
jgi:AhpC/TSA family